MMCMLIIILKDKSFLSLPDAHDLSSNHYHVEEADKEEQSQSCRHGWPHCGCLQVGEEAFEHVEVGCAHGEHEGHGEEEDKEASGKFSQIADIIAGVPKSFSVLSGDDDITMSMMNAGASGVISVASNAIPELMVEFVEALGAPQVCGADFVSAPDMARSAELFYRLRPFFSACFVESNPIPVKAALALMGLIHNELRLPLVPCSENTERLMREVLGKLGYLK